MAVTVRLCFRHFKEQLRRQNGITERNLSSPSSPSGATPVIEEHQQQCQLQEVTQNNVKIIKANRSATPTLQQVKVSPDPKGLPLLNNIR